MKSSYSIDQLKVAINAQFNGVDASAQIDSLLIDSRKVVKTEGVLFVAIKGSRNDGHDYISELYDLGVCNFVVEHLPENRFLFENANFLLVDNGLKALQSLAVFHRSHFDIPVIGVTGSNGKTVVKEWLFQGLQSTYKVVRSPKSYNSQVGVPLSVWQMNPEHEVAIFEAGISQPGEMKHLQSIIQPQIGIFTNIGQAHGYYFEDAAQKIREKLKLFKACDTLIYCLDHVLIDQEIQKSDLAAKQCFTWSSYRDADLKVTHIHTATKPTKIEAVYKGEAQFIKIPFSDKASIENAMHCWASMLVLGLEQDQIQEALMQLVPVAMRLEMRDGVNNCLLINDVYSSDLESLKIALDFVNQQQPLGHKTVVLSDMLESTLKQEALYQEVASLMEKYQVSRLIGVGEEIQKFSHLFKMKAVFFRTTRQLVQAMSVLKFKDETILLKGARRFAFEELAQLLSLKAHTTVMEVDLNALIHNYQQFKSRLKPETKVMAMVKAFSYGTGSSEIAKILQFHRVDYLGVAYVDEGVDLRENGVDLPIMVMNSEEGGFDQMIRYRLEPEIYSVEQLQQFYRMVQLQPTEDVFGVHVKVDSGMHRLGFDIEEVASLGKMLKSMPRLKVLSVFSHLAASDQPDLAPFTMGQFDEFEQAYELLSEQLGYRPIRHMLNSGGIENYTDQQYEMVRLGIGLYGVGSLPELRTVARLKTRISQIKQVKKGESVGYNRSHIANEDIAIAILPIGYADGLSRLLGNQRGSVYLAGEKRPILGAVCMDMCFVDVTHLSVKVGDEVEVFGDHISIHELAQQMSTIPYEVLTGVSGRVKRLYFQD